MIGSTLGHFHITDRLGEGGMGEVYLATDTRLDRRVAIKVLPEDVAGDQDRRGRFEAEARAASAIIRPSRSTPPSSRRTTCRGSKTTQGIWS